MKNLLTTFILFSSLILSSQNIYEYEREISNPENYIYKEIEVNNTKENIKLYGTLITPKKEFDKVIIIVPGSGKDTRYSHYKLAEKFLKNNIAIFRYDERGNGKSEGKDSWFLYGIEEMKRDLTFFINVLKNDVQLSNKAFGLLGHSFGGMATIGVVQNGIKIDFLIQWATPVEKHGRYQKYQLESGLFDYNNTLKFENDDEKIKIMETVSDVVEKNLKDDDKTLRKKLDKETKKYGYKRKNWERFKYYTGTPTLDLLRQNYEATYKNINIPLLYVIGSEDKFVSSKYNIELLKSFNNNKIETKIFNGLNHYLRKGEINPLERKETPILYDLNNEVLEEIIRWTLSK